MLRTALIIAFIALLQACASSRMAEELGQGKISFTEGRFAEAFHELLPVAVDGNNPEAEYAIGYLYYYGYGIDRDEQTGLFWMQRAAQQGYKPAQRALMLINQENLAPMKHRPVTMKVNHFRNNDERVLKKFSLLQTLHQELMLLSRRLSETNRHVQYQHRHASESWAETSSRGLTAGSRNARLDPAAIQDRVRDDRHVKPLTDAQANYLLQLMGDYSLSNVESLQKTLAEKNTHIWRTKHHGRDWFILTYGQYQQAHDAKLALNHLPHSLRDLHPWVKPL